MKRITLTYRFLMIVVFTTFICLGTHAQDKKFLERGHTYEWSIEDENIDYRWELRDLYDLDPLKSSVQAGNDFEYTFDQPGWYELKVYFQDVSSGEVHDRYCPSDATIWLIYVNNFPDFKVEIKEGDNLSFCQKDTLCLHPDITATRINEDPTVTQTDYVINLKEFDFRWYNSTNEVVGTDTLLKVTSEDNYYLEVYYKYNQSLKLNKPDAEKDFFVEEHLLPVVNIAGEYVYAPGTDMTIDEANGPHFYKKYEWFSKINNDTDLVYRNDSKTYSKLIKGAGDYKLQVTDEYGCVNSATTVVDMWENVAMSTAFSPNGDGNNDALLIHGDLDNVKENTFVLTIYDRSGLKIFESTNINEMSKSRDAKGWNGRNMYTGELCPVDGYVYFMQVEFTDGQKMQKKGVVSLLR